MRRFLAQILIGSASIVLVALVLSFINLSYIDPSTDTPYDGPVMGLASPALLTATWFALLFAVVDAVLRPILMIASGRLLLRTMGGFLIVVNVLVILFVDWLAGNAITFAAPRLLWAVVTAILFTLVDSAIEIVVGVDRPSIDITDRDRIIWRLLDRMPTPRRSRIIENIRLVQVWDTISRFGFEIVVGGGVLSGVRGWAQRRLGRTDRDIESLSTPAKVRVMLQQLGPTWVKIGQMVSSRSEALPPEWAAELDKLQNTVPPVSWEEAREVLTNELGRPPEEVFASIDHEPIAAASMAQVHRATLPDGREVAVKVQRPDVRVMVRADLNILLDIAAEAERRSEMARHMDAQGILGEFADGILRELDYRNETYNMRRVAANMAAIEGVRIPWVDRQRSRSRVVTMEFVRGVKVTRVDELDRAGVERDVIARRFLRAIVKQVLVDGFFHADPHPGNLYVDPATSELIFLDWGLVGRLDERRRLDFIGLMWSVVNKDATGIADVALRLTTPTGTVDEGAVRDAIAQAVDEHLVFADEGTDLGIVLGEVLGTLYANNLRLDQDFTLALKAIVQAEEIARTLDPSFDLLQAGLSDVLDLLAAELTAEKLVARTRAAAASAARDLVRRIPDLVAATTSWVDQYEKGRIVVKLDTSSLSRDLASFDRVGRTLSGAALLAGSVVGTAIVVAAIIFSNTDISVFVPLPLILTIVFAGILFVSLRRSFALMRPAPDADEPATTRRTARVRTWLRRSVA